MSNPNEFYGPNLGYILELYERYRENQESLDPSIRDFFEDWSPPLNGSQFHDIIAETSQGVGNLISIYNLANAIRTYGYLDARLDPLGSEPRGDPWLNPSFHNITEQELHNLPPGLVEGPVSLIADNALEATNKLREIYCGKIGYDYGHIRDPEEREWLRATCEEGLFRPPKKEIDALRLLDRLSQVEALEKFLHRTFPGKSRFSIEGLDMMIPMIDEILRVAVEEDICLIKLGMAHRGRINVLAHILQKPYSQILAEFQDPSANITTKNELGWTGDVKYHKGGRAELEDEDTIQLVLSMPANPSHLEHINPVITGMARAAGSVSNQPGNPKFLPNACLPLLIHGDASFPAQGIVAETLNLSRLPGYTVGGALHIVANNQIGFTTMPEEGRSTLHASDLAKGFGIPIIHVNADEPEECIEAVCTGFEYRQKFHKDFVINLIGYRRYGHNEGDEPSFTQPLMYEKIKSHPSVRSIFAEGLIDRDLTTDDQVNEMVRSYMTGLQDVYEDLEPEEEILTPQLEPPPPGKARSVKTAISLSKLRELNQALLDVPNGFNLHPKLQRTMRKQRDVLEDPDKPSVDWTAAEQLAIASILADGTPIRMTGEDTGRGTFSQRHAVFIDVDNGKEWIPLREFPQAKVSFEIINSPLSENAALAFEFGYNLQSPQSLVIWEAQYGDFINVAQAIVDEFITSGRAKWEVTPSLVMLLPHGYEGQGPDHSSARLERFLQLAAQTNIRIANCTTAAQYFHLLRRQAALLESDPLPLVVLTPKSLLRNPLVASPPQDLSQGTWQPVLDDQRANQDPEKIHRLILCSGKIYVDLFDSELYENNKTTAIVRLEQLYRFPFSELSEVIEPYTELKEVVWVQEEPQNMGAWNFVKSCLQETIQNRWPLQFVGRIENASPAEGSASRYKINQKAIINKAFGQQIESSPSVSLVEKD